MRDKSQQALQASKYPWAVARVSSASDRCRLGGRLWWNQNLEARLWGAESQRRQPPLFGSGSPAWVSGSAFPSKSGCGHGSPLVSGPPGLWLTYSWLCPGLRRPPGAHDSGQALLSSGTLIGARLVGARVEGVLRVP